jgi:hypothetical protein
MGTVNTEEGVPVRICPPSLPCWSHLGGLGHISHAVVSLSQLVLNPLKGAEGVPWGRAAVASVTVHFAPSLEEDRQCADVGLSHCLHKCPDVRKDVVVHIPGTKAWSLTLILEDNHIPVSVPDPVQAVGGMPLQCLTSRRTSICGCRKAGALGDLLNNKVHWFTTSGSVCVAVAKEKNVLVSAAVSGIAFLWESRLRVGTCKRGTRVSVCWTI